MNEYTAYIKPIILALCYCVSLLRITVIILCSLAP